MAGIYIHIPFCKQACHYCNFHFSTSLAYKSDVIQAMLSEIRIRANAEEEEIAIISKEEHIETIYFGGGTPSLLTESELHTLLAAIHANYTIDKNAEITLEANPDDMEPVKLAQWKNAGINRLSIGIQSFREADLKWMNRAHNAAQARTAIEQARLAGFDNFSIDLIFGVPGLSLADWEENVSIVTGMQIPHIACYALTVENGTALKKMIALKKKENVDSDEQAAHFTLLMQKMNEAGYEHYEISNFAKPGYRSRHNSSYWQGKKYIGIGPSAHSFNGKMRLWNRAHNIEYYRSLLQEVIPYEKEILSPVDQLNEYIMVSLRTAEGMDLAHIRNKFSLDEYERINKLVINELLPGQYVRKVEQIILTPQGKLLADAITVKLFSA